MTPEQQIEHHCQRLIPLARSIENRAPGGFPLALFYCHQLQRLHRVHFYQPALILVLRGTKAIAEPFNTECRQGNMLLIPQGYEFPFSNQPNEFYMALVLGFDSEDFLQLDQQMAQTETARLQADSLAAEPQPIKIVSPNVALLTLLEQVLNLASSDLPLSFWQSRRLEILQLLHHQGLSAPLLESRKSPWQQKLIRLLQQDLSREWQLAEVCQALHTSESSLRRHLQNEDTGFRQLLEELRLTQGLGMLQTTRLSVGQIALECGYQSPSRFSDRFKKRFEISPSQIRHTRDQKLD